MTAADGDALARADAVLRAHGKTFTWARRFLGSRHAARATRLYAFCRFLDDVADEGGDPAEAARSLAEVRQALVTGRSGDPVVAEVLDLFRDSARAREAASALVDGVVGDLGQVAFESERELLRYCYRVAGTVGVMMCEVLDQREEVAAPFAVDLGIAMQLTNIARDVFEDAERGRRYVPADMVEGAHAQAIAAMDARTRAVVRRARLALLQRAESYYDSGRRGLVFLPLRARFAILVAAENYRAIGRRVRALGDAAEVRAVVSPAAKLWITVRVIVAALFRPSFWRRPRRHDARLHEHLGGLCGVDPAARTHG
ncbi:MAG: phytoene/squalene synthase family protein [Planctomycetota bacterium]|nr:phytoene/squalene synthase family protein [Planctomycetota bacterium]